MPDCFVIMPISTPKELTAQYGDDQDHFRHVLNHLFKPAVEEAGFNMIPPNFGGSELIPAEIVTSLEKSDLVLCDISSLNPNVFLELGIRIALNKPVAMIKDRFTERVPFDTAAIGHHTHDESITAWTLGSEIKELTAHIQQVQTAGDQNSMWRYFGMRLQAGAPPGETGVDQRLNYIMQKLDQLGTHLVRGSLPEVDPKLQRLVVQKLHDTLSQQPMSDSAQKFMFPEGDYTWSNLKMEVERGTPVGLKYVNLLVDSAAEVNLSLLEFLGLNSR